MCSGVTDRTGDLRYSALLRRGRALVRCAALIATCLLPAAAVHGSETRTFDVAIRNDVVVGAKSVRVTRGDSVVLRWTSDRRVELHLHGYDVTATLAPDAPAEMRFVARASGRFPVEIHGRAGGGHRHGHRTIFHLEVYPD